MITMTVRCDGRNCSNKTLFYENDPYEAILIATGWSIDLDNELHYCSDCKKKMIENGEYTEGDYE